MSSVKEWVYSTIEHAITQEPRTLQEAMGPSELAMDCEHCLAARLAGWVKMPEAAWLPWIGTAVHAKLEETFGGRDDCVVEARVHVGRVRDQEIFGTGDLFKIAEGQVIDHKIVGKSTLTSAKRGPTKQYRGQVHLYGLGFFRAGYDVKKVSINYLPRNDISMRRGEWFEEDWDAKVAIAALDRVERLADELDALAAISPELRDAHITDLPRHSKCFDCGKYPDAPKASPKTQTVESLLGL